MIVVIIVFLILLLLLIFIIKYKCSKSNHINHEIHELSTENFDRAFYKSDDAILQLHSGEKLPMNIINNLEKIDEI